MEETIKIPRLVKSGEVNDNGYLFDEESLKKSLEIFKANKGEIRFDGYTMEEINTFIDNRTLTDDKYQIIGKLVDYDDEYIYMTPLTKTYDAEKLSGYYANIHAVSDDIKDVDTYKLAIIDEVTRIVVGVYVRDVEKNTAETK